MQQKESKEYKEYKEFKEFKETRGRACEQPSGIAWYQKDSKSAITAKILLTLLLELLVLLHPLRASAMGRAFGGWSCGRRWPGGGGFGFGGRCVLLQLVENFQVVVGGIKFRPKRAPDSFFESNVDLSELIRWQSQRDDVADPHDDVIRNDLDPFRREILDEAGLGQVVVDFVQGFALVVTQDNSQHDFPVVGCLLSKKQGRSEKKPAEQDPFHGFISSVR